MDAAGSHTGLRAGRQTMKRQSKRMSAAISGGRLVGVKANQVSIAHERDDGGHHRRLRLEQGVLEMQDQMTKLIRACLYSLRYGVPARPIELRPLHDPKSQYNHDKGSLKLWLEILTPAQADMVPSLDIAPSTHHSGELRVIVWKAKRLPSKDLEGNFLSFIPGQGDGGVNDPYVKVWMESNDGPPQTTDTHLRSKKGRAEWNYRVSELQVNKAN
jgi:hypothetical protein